MLCWHHSSLLHSFFNQNHYLYRPFSSIRNKQTLVDTQFCFRSIMERQQSFKLDRKPSLEEEPRTLSRKDYELAMAALKAYLQGNIEDESPEVEDEKVAKAMQPAQEEKPAAPKPTEEPGSGSGSGSGNGGSDLNLPALA